MYFFTPKVRLKTKNESFIAVVCWHVYIHWSYLLGYKGEGLFEKKLMRRLDLIVEGIDKTNIKKHRQRHNIKETRMIQNAFFCTHIFSGLFDHVWIIIFNCLTTILGLGPSPKYSRPWWHHRPVIGASNPYLLQYYCSTFRELYLHLLLHQLDAFPYCCNCILVTCNTR